MSSPNPEERNPESICKMFARVSPNYDRINRAMCLGLDIIWRKALAKKAINEGNNNLPILDLACGSGDVSLEILKRFPDKKICACDLCPQMLEIAKSKLENEGLDAEYICANAENLPFEDEKFGACTIAFGLRNFQNRKKCLEEIHRVLNKDGGLFILEVARARPIFEPVQNFFMDKAVPNIAAFFGGNKSDYAYLAKTTRSFPNRKSLESLIEECGFKNIKTQNFAFGFVALTKAFKI